jgi:SAM-dependent methyltransferase
MGALPQGEAEALTCPRCSWVAARREGVWDLLTPAEATAVERFVREYTTVRHAEGRALGSAEAYRALPACLAGHPLAWQWRIRARSLATLERRVMPEGGGLRVLDLGAGSGWLSHRLARRGHRALAVDLSVDGQDGLGAARHFDAVLDEPFPRLRAHFDRLPLASGCVDLAVFNASFHYSADFERTLREALRVLGPGGRVVILDSPIYRNPQSGRRMVAERRAAFEARYGFPSDALGSREFLTEDDLAGLGQRLALAWRRIRPWYGWRWWLRPLRAALLGRREPARFEVLVATPLAAP